MLSYLRDPNLAELPADKETQVSQQQEQECLTVATHGKDVRKSTTILGVLFIIGLICLGIMIKKSEPQKAAASTTVNTDEQQIQSAITRLTGIESEMFKRMDEIVKKFYQFSDVVQIQVNQLVKNPFQLESFLESMNANTGNNNSGIDAEMILQEQARVKSEKMKLYSIMQSERGTCCMINNKILYEGDTIDDFEVVKISTDNVLLKLEKFEITLRLSK
jgi:preprotein translocase subunit SecG